jgi:phosphatidylserine decarboxylase
MVQLASPKNDLQPPKADATSFSMSSIQPGGGRIMELELFWGKLRRWFLKTFFPKYVADSKSRLNGDPKLCPHDVIDSRDLKFHRNIVDCHFEEKDDLFAWRKNIPMATDGFFEMLVFAGPPLLIAHLLYWYVGGWWNLLTVPLAVFGLFVISFFRDPHRLIPTEEGVIVSPADGRITDITEVEHHKVSQGPVVRVGIFLSVFNVHVNRAPSAGRVLSLKYRQGQFLDARNKDAGEVNENLETLFAETKAPYRKFAVKQISGAIARRIVCDLRLEKIVERGQRYGMIKFGSRTELYLPKHSVELDVRIGDKVSGGSTVLGRWLEPTADDFKPPKGKEPPAPKGPPPVDDDRRDPPIPLAADSPSGTKITSSEPTQDPNVNAGSLLRPPGYGLSSK